MNFILKQFLWRLLSRPIVRAVQWTPEERNSFELFCRSSCGIKLFEFLRQIVASKTFKCVYQNSVSGNAEARGAQDILGVLHRLRVFPQEESAYFLWRLLSRPIVRAVQWTPEERNSFELFCRSACGIKLLEFLRQTVANATFGAVYQNKVSANAHARGMQDILGVLHRLRVFPQEESAYDGLVGDTEPASQAESRDAWRLQGGRGAIG